MRIVAQRVTSASVSVGSEIVSSIGKGICVFVGISRDDNKDDIEYIVRKMLNLRLFDDNESTRRWEKSIKDLSLEILCVSQFTLHASLKKNRPDFHRSMSADEAPIFYEEFLNHLRKEYDPSCIKDGVFGAMMNVKIENDGPVTVTLDSKCRD